MQKPDTDLCSYLQLPVITTKTGSKAGLDLDGRTSLEGNHGKGKEEKDKWSL